MVDDGNITQVTQISILHIHVLYMYWNQCIYCLRLNVNIACLFKKFNRDLELLAVDAEKAFDTVNHDIMLNKLYHDGITGDMWLLLRNICDGLILKVKWGDQTTESIDIKHRKYRYTPRCKTVNLTRYKRYNNTILDSITKSTLGATIGNITVSAPACADEIALLGESKDMQAMLNLLEYNTKRDLVKLNPEKN